MNTVLVIIAALLGVSIGCHVITWVLLANALFRKGEPLALPAPFRPKEKARRKPIAISEAEAWRREQEERR